MLIFAVLLVPILPFLSFGDALESTFAGWLDPPPSSGTVAALTVAILASDILLPVPSSLISTIAGARLGILQATAASWLGMTLGAVAGFYLARTWGRPLAARFSSADDLTRMDRLVDRYGVGIVILTRALPVLAEAAILGVGLMRLEPRRFLLTVIFSNLGIALVYAVLGQMAESRGELPLALAASIALPLAAATIARYLLR